MGALGIAAGVGAAGSLASAANGIFGGDQSQTSTSTQGPPAWVQKYYQQAANLANKVGQTPLNQYQGPMVAGFSPMQYEAMQGVQNAQGIANPYINTASQYASSAATPINVPGQLSNGQLGGLYSGGLGYSNQAANANIQGASQAGRALAYQGANAGAAAANQGIGSINQAVGMGSAQNYGQNVNQYMSPYTQDVVNATQAQFNNQNQQQQQSVIGNAITSGAWGGDRASVAQGITAGQQQLAQAPVIAGLYNSGYTNAQQQLNTQQQLGLQGGQAAGQLGLAAGQLQSQNALAAAGMNQSAAAQQAALQQQAAAQQLGLFSGQQQTGIGAQEATGWLGANAANIYGALGQQAQSSALTGASALWNMGQQQQNLHQQQLNVPYEQFQAQQAYPLQMAGWQANILEGLGSGAGGSSSTTTPGPSGLGQAFGGLTSAAGYLGNAGLFSSTPSYSQMGSYLSPQPITQYQDPGQVPMFQRGGRIERAAGGSMAAAAGNSPFGAFAQPMASGGVFGGMGNYRRGGHVPEGFGPGGAAGHPQYAVNHATSQLDDMEMGSRGIEHPMLSMPTNSPMPTNGIYNQKSLESDYSPPPVGSEPYSQTTFPVLSGGSPKASPISRTITPVEKNGAWMSPAAASAPKPADNSAPTTLAQVYQDLLHRGVDPSGQSYFGGMAIPDVIAQIKQSPEYLGLQGHAAGGPVGFRAHYDAGGDVANAAAAQAGAPVDGGNPIAAGSFQAFAKLPPEKLQELAVRLPPNSTQGQMARRALMLARMNSTAGQGQGQPQGQPEMAAGGRIGLADGGDPFSTADIDSAPSFGPTLPTGFADYDSPGASKAPASIFDLVGGNDVAAAKGFGPLAAGAPPADTPDASAPRHHAPRGFSAHPSSVPDAPAVHASAPAPADTTPSHFAPTPNDIVLAPDDYKPNPWQQLQAMGAGALASTSPFAGVAIGEGIQAGLQYQNVQQKQALEARRADQENQWHNRDVDLRVQELSNTLDYHKQSLAQQSKAEADRVQAEQDRLGISKQELGLRAAGLGIEQQNANRPDMQYIGNTPDGQHGIFLNTRSPNAQQVLGDPVNPKNALTPTHEEKLADYYVKQGLAHDTQTAAVMIANGFTKPAQYNAAIQASKNSLAKGNTDPLSPLFGTLKTDADIEKAARAEVASRGLAAGFGKAAPGVDAQPPAAPAAGGDVLAQARAAIAAGAPRDAVAARLQAAGVDPSGL